MNTFGEIISITFKLNLLGKIFNLENNYIRIIDTYFLDKKKLVYLNEKKIFYNCNIEYVILLYLKKYYHRKV